MRIPKFLKDFKLLFFINKSKHCTIIDIRNKFEINENTLQKKLKKWVDKDLIERKKISELRLGGPKFEYKISSNGLEVLEIIKKEICN